MRALRSDDARSLRYIAYSKHGFAASDGKRILFFPEDGGTATEIVRLPASREDIEIRALSWIDRTIYYYSSGKIWYTDPSGRERGDALRGVKFSPPYGRFYDVLLVPSGTELAVVAGIAGGYNLSLADVMTRDVRIKKWPVASRRILFSGKEIQMLRGGSGNWKLVSVSLPGENVTTIKTFRSLSDIILFQDCYIYRDSDLHMATGENDIKIPVNLEILGGDNGMLFCRIKGSVCVVPVDRLRLALDIMQELVPDYPGLQ